MQRESEFICRLIEFAKVEPDASEIIMRFGIAGLQLRSPQEKLASFTPFVLGGEQAAELVAGLGKVGTQPHGFKAMRKCFRSVALLIEQLRQEIMSRGAPRFTA